MLLTEAVHIVTMMAPQVCRDAWVCPATDALLRTVCGWRLHATAQYEELARLLSVGHPCSPNDLRIRETYSTKDCVEMALRDGEETPASLAQRCGCTPSHLLTIINRLRADGRSILWQSHGAGSGTYRLAPLPAKAS